MPRPVALHLSRERAGALVPRSFGLRNAVTKGVVILVCMKLQLRSQLKFAVPFSFMHVPGSFTTTHGLYSILTPCVPFCTSRHDLSDAPVPMWP